MKPGMSSEYASSVEPRLDREVVALPLADWRGEEGGEAERSTTAPFDTAMAGDWISF